MNRIKQLRDTCATNLAAADALAVKAETEKRSLSKEEIEQYNKLIDETDALTAEIKTLERGEATRSSVTAMSTATADPLEQSILLRKDPLAEAETRASALSTARVTDRAEGKHFRSLGEQLQAIASAASNPRAADPRLDLNNREVRAASGLNESIGSEGEFLLQPTYVQDLLLKANETGLLQKLCRTFTLGGNSNQLTIYGAIDEQSRADGSRWGGVQSYWQNEADATTATKPKFRKLEFKLKKLFAVCYATDELLADSTALESIISQAYASETGFKIDDAIFNGDGVGKPMGILNSPALLTVAKESGQATATIVWANIAKMRMRTWLSSRSNGVWLINHDAEQQLQSMFLPTGTTGVPVWMPAGGISGLPYDTMFGRPVMPIEQAKTLGTVGDVVYADFSQYIIADKGGINGAASMHVRFLNDEMTYRFTTRIDGMTSWNSVLTPAQGSNTLSPFVALATR